MYFIRAIGDSAKSCLRKYRWNKGVLTNPHATKHLHSTVCDVLCHIRPDNFQHRNIRHSGLYTFAVHDFCRLQCQQSTLFDLAATAGDLMLYAGFLNQLFTEGYTLTGTLAHQLHTTLSLANKRHGVLETARP